MNELEFKEQLRNLTYAKEMYLNELITLLKYKDTNMIDKNRTRALSDIDLMIKTMEELREKIK